jgi:hypothetical protein
MKKIQVVVIGVDFKDNPEEAWKNLKHLEFLRELEIHFVHISSSDNIEAPVYPSGEMKLVIEHSILLKLNQLASELLPKNCNHPIVAKCLFDTNPKKAFSDYAEKVGAQLVILSRGKKNHLSIRSFIQYQVRHSRSNVLVLKSI